MIDPRSLDPRPTAEPEPALVSLEDLRLVQLLDLACALEAQLALNLLSVIYASTDEDDGVDVDGT